MAKKYKQVGVRKKTGIEPYTPQILRDMYNKHVKGLTPPVVGQIEETYKAFKRSGKTTPKMRKEYASFKKRQKEDKIERKKESKRSSSESLINCMKKANTDKKRAYCKTTFALKMKK